MLPSKTVDCCSMAHSIAGIIIFMISLVVVMLLLVLRQAEKQPPPVVFNPIKGLRLLLRSGL